MPSPRPSGSGVRKILPLPHRLKDQVLHFIALLPDPLQPIIGAFFVGGPFGVRIDNSGFAFPFLGRGLSFLETVTREVSELLAVETLYSPHVPSFSLPPNVPLAWRERGPWWWFLERVFAGFGYPGSPSVCRGIHSVWIASPWRGVPGIVEFCGLLISINLLLPIVAVFPFYVSFSGHGFPVIIVAGRSRRRVSR